MNQVTVTAKTGIGEQVTAHVFDDLRNLEFDYDAMILKVTYGLNHTIRFFQLQDVTTVTDSVSSNVHTWVVS